MLNFCILIPSKENSFPTSYLVNSRESTARTIGIVLNGAVGALIPEGVEASFEQEIEVLLEDASRIVEDSGHFVLDETLVSFTWLRKRDYEKRVNI
jgi:hypothetical protein